MKVFIDSANAQKIKSVIEYFPFDGITTNPTIVAREKGDCKKILLSLRELAGDKLLFAQVTSSYAIDMVNEAKVIKSAIGGNLCIKVPATKEGLKAIKELKSEGFCVTATAVFNTQQIMLCAKAKADFVAPYISHIDSLCIDSAVTIREMATLLNTHFPNTEILAASFRVSEQINRVILAGAHAITIAPEMFDSLITSRQTETEIDSFKKNWSDTYSMSGISELLK